MTPDEMGETGPQRLQSHINGQAVQVALLSKMIFGLSKQFEDCSNFTCLEPGGVGAKRIPPLWIKPGDTFEVEIDGVGLLRTPIMQEA